MFCDQTLPPDEHERTTGEQQKTVSKTTKKTAHRAHRVFQRVRGQQTFWGGFGLLTRRRPNTNGWQRMKVPTEPKPCHLSPCPDEH